MHLEGTQLIGADRATVWAALNDPEILSACIPGCQSMEGSVETGFSAVVKQKVGPVSATFKGKVSLTNLNPPESYTISGEGEGGAAGFAKGGADVRLVETAGGTALTYVAEAKIGGKIAQLGARLIDGFAKKMADQFFTTFKATVEARDPGTAARYAAAAEAAAAEAAAAEAAAAEAAAPAAAPAAPARTAAAPQPAAQAAKPAVAPVAAAAPEAAPKKSWWKRIFG
jgi:carbon monoxide dehydrogenase subunit G